MCGFIVGLGAWEVSVSYLSWVAASYWSPVAPPRPAAASPVPASSPPFARPWTCPTPACLWKHAIHKHIQTSVTARLPPGTLISHYLPSTPNRAVISHSNGTLLQLNSHFEREIEKKDLRIL